MKDAAQERIYKRESRLLAKSLGVCTRCFKNDAQEGFAYCASCRSVVNSAPSRSTNYRPRWEQKHVKAGRCKRCGNEPLASTRYGVKCLRKFRAATSKDRPVSPIRWCSLCSKAGRERKPGDRHNARSCPFRFKIDVVEYATARRAA